MFWYDGQLIRGSRLELAIDHPGLLYGATVFTTLRVYQQSLHHPLTHWSRHCDRLMSSLQTFGWQQPDWERLRFGAEQCTPSYPVLRITIFPDGREWITGRSLPSDLTQRQQQGITAWLANAPEYQRTLAAYKTGNYLSAWLAGQAARQQGASEAVLVDTTGRWLETSTGNLWGWQEGCWWTPPLEAGILPGVVRSQLIHWLQAQDYPVQEVPWDRERVLNFEAIAYTNSVVEVIPIHTVLASSQSLTYDAFHPALERLRSLWRQYHADLS
ncbi:MAG TPA: aminotransferase class IV [Stenomitos sp.]